MKIEQLIPPKKPGGFWLAQVEGRAPLLVSEGELLAFSLYVGMELSEETMDALQAAAQKSAFQEWAVGLLSQRLMSAGELQQKLRKKGAEENQAEEIVCRMVQIGLLNDALYAKTVAKHYHGKGYGDYKIKDELYRRQVPRIHWEDALEDLEPADAQIDQFLEQKLTDPTDRKESKRMSDALRRRGFSWSEISTGMDRFREAYQKRKGGA